MQCRMCHGTDLELFLDLGFIPLVDRFIDSDELNKQEALYPLEVYFCKECGLSQSQLSIILNKTQIVLPKLAGFLGENPFHLEKKDFDTS